MHHKIFPIRKMNWYINFSTGSAADFPFTFKLFYVYLKKRVKDNSKVYIEIETYKDKDWLESRILNYFISLKRFGYFILLDNLFPR